MISLKTLLDTPRFSDLKLITDESSINDRIIESVEITETPDVEKFIPKNVLILSTGMVFKNKQENLIPFIDSLIRAESIGLCIKVNRFLNEIDSDVIAYANKVSFPLIIIPDHYPLGSLLHQIMNLVLENRREEIDFALDIQKSFSNLLVQDASNDLLVSELSRIIKTSIILLDPFNQIIAQSEYFKNHQDRAEHCVTSILNERKVTNRIHGSFLITDLDGKLRNVSVHEIRVHTYFSHYLIIVDSEKIPFPTSIFAIEQAALVFQFNLYKNQKVDESLYATEAHLFSDLLDPQVPTSFNDISWFQGTRGYGYIQSNFYKVIHIISQEMVGETKRAYTVKESEKFFLSYVWLRNNINKYFSNAVVIYRSEIPEIVLILQETDSEISNKLESISNNILNLIDSKLLFHVGYSVTKSEQIEQSYAQAKLAYNDRIKNSNQDAIIFYKEKGMLQLFSDLNQNTLIYYCKSVLKELAYPEEESLIDLRKTLDIYLKNQCEITQTASDLFIHRNTVKYRINRCEEILGTSVNDPEASLDIRLALELSNQP
ncbi:PucR family transcriptional regulator [Fundicoccus culcitae]|uniref:PucR family transcriptional regulator ligand-binding domain-containing protein n=1 Tax=Fundicoccus culcitae TaxID=2969821 RepID=A0ABY5P989_9LACT|nr:PucR family transcriptional regulator [Fundicoccus culcitae]UUX35319.1 PucR family transcriptional regulator ligand-binding domain-containing protein [Fundicoccus culcitae]